jgi:hypothetical protein
VIGFLASPRLRRRLFWTCAFAAAAVSAAALVIALPGGRSLSDDSAPPSGRFEPVAPVAAPPKPLRVTPKVRRQVNATLVPFIRHAVGRERPELAWTLVTPALRIGTTRAQWRRGDIPVFPFPARPEEATGWRVLEAFEDDLLISLLVHARANTNEGAIAFQIELKRVGRGSKGRWLVDSLIPERTYPAASRPTAPRRTSTVAADTQSGRLGMAWLILPAALLSLIVLVPVTVALLNWRRGVRAERAYERRREAAQDGPPVGR